MCGFNEVENRGFEVLKGGVIMGVQAAFFHQLPEPFDQVELRRIRREKQQFDLQGGGGVLHQPTALIAGVVQNDGDRNGQGQLRQLAQQLTDTGAIDVGLGGGNGDPFVGDGVERPQHAEAVPAGGGRLPAAGHAPQPAQKQAVDEMGGIHKKHRTLTRLRLGQAWFQFLLLESRLFRLPLGGRGRAGDRPGLAPFQPELLEHLTHLGRTALDPGQLRNPGCWPRPGSPAVVA